MTIGELKQIVFKLLDEARPKSDLTGKLSSFIQMGQMEIATTVCPIEKESVLVGDCSPFTDLLLPGDFFRLHSITQENPDGTMTFFPKYRLLGDGKIRLLQKGSYFLKYDAFPTPILEDTPDDTPLEIPLQAQGALPFFVAAQCHSTEYDQRFFSSFLSQYQGKLLNIQGNRRAIAQVLGGERDV